MTQPTTIFFGPDGKGAGDPKVYLRTLLFSTSTRGQVIESMHVRLHRGESVQTFNIWVYRDGSDKLFRGSGLFVGREGLAYDHHFLLPKEGSTYEFIAGDYRLEVYATLLGKKSQKMFSVELQVSNEQAEKLKDSYGLYYDWGPESSKYHPYLRQPDLTAEDIEKLLT